MTELVALLWCAFYLAENHLHYEMVAVGCRIRLVISVAFTQQMMSRIRPTDSMQATRACHVCCIIPFRMPSTLASAIQVYARCSIPGFSHLQQGWATATFAFRRALYLFTISGQLSSKWSRHVVARLGENTTDLQKMRKGT